MSTQISSKRNIKCQLVRYMKHRVTLGTPWQIISLSVQKVNIGRYKKHVEFFINLIKVEGRNFINNLFTAASVRAMKNASSAVAYGPRTD